MRHTRVLVLLAVTGLVACSSDDDAGGSSSGDTTGVDGGTSSSGGSSGTTSSGGSSGGSSSGGSSSGGSSSGGSSSGGSSSGGTDAGPPSHSDGVLNLGETDVDCGGTTPDATGQAPRCADGKGCGVSGDCANAFCNPTTKKCATPAANDGFQNGTETDIDCGGGGAGVPACNDGKKCAAKTDCKSKVCTGNVCQVPTGTDGEQNGDESDVDCGGTTTGAPKCATGKTCSVNEDCASLGCNYAKKCAAGRSCTQQYGGVTCGSGETGQPGAMHEDCCSRVNIPNGPGGVAFAVDKYLVTAGRMRSFLEAINGKVRDYIAANTPAWWNAAWTPYLPNSWDGREDMGGGNYAVPAGEHINIYSTYAQVAGGIIHDAPANQGCWIGSGAFQSYGHPTYLVPRDMHMKNGRQTLGASDIYGDAYQRWLTQNQLDEKPMNCTSYLMFAALCAYDGGRVVSEDEYNFIYDVDGTGAVSTYPWGVYNTAGVATPGGFRSCQGQWRQVGPGQTGFTCNACPTCELDWVNWSFNYQYPAVQPNPFDQSFFISAPGRFPKGGSRIFNGNPADRVHDIAGLMIEATRTQLAPANTTLTFGNTDPADNRTVSLDRVRWRGGSFEGHGLRDAYTFTVLTKYGKMGTRCVY